MCIRDNICFFCTICCEEKFPAAAHCGQSRALLLRCFGHVQSYTPSAARAQNTFLDSHCIRRCKQAVLCFVTNPVACVFHMTRDIFQ